METPQNENQFEPRTRFGRFAMLYFLLLSTATPFASNETLIAMVVGKKAEMRSADDLLVIKPKKHNVQLRIKLTLKAEGGTINIYKIKARITDSLGTVANYSVDREITGHKVKEFEPFDLHKEALKTSRYIFTQGLEERLKLQCGRMYHITISAYQLDNGPPLVQDFRFDISQNQKKMLESKKSTKITLIPYQ